MKIRIGRRVDCALDTFDRALDTLADSSRYAPGTTPPPTTRAGRAIDRALDTLTEPRRPRSRRPR